MKPRKIIMSNTRMEDKDKIETVQVELIRSSDGSLTVRVNDLPGFYDYFEITLPAEWIRDA